MRVLRLVLLLAIVAGAAHAQPYFWIQFLEPVANSAALPSCASGSVNETRARWTTEGNGSIYYCPSGGGSWVCMAGDDCPAAGGSSIVLDLADDDTNESSALSEFATQGDDNAIFTEPTANKLLIDLGQNWPASDAATALAANGGNCSAGSYPLGVDASGAAESCTDATTEINSLVSTHTANASAHHAATVDTDTTCSDASCDVGTDDTVTLAQGLTPTPTVEGRLEWDTDDNRIVAGNGTGQTTFYSGDHTADTDTTCNDAGVACLFAASLSEGGAATTATALAANGGNCTAGSYPLGVDASGAVESCTDATTEIDSAVSTHAGNASAHHAPTVDTGPLVDCVGSTTYQDGEGGCDTLDAGTDITADLEEETHASEHENGGADEVSVSGLSGRLADAQSVLTHATDCTSITTGVSGDLCYELDEDTLYSCQPSAGGCDTAGEWALTGDGGGGGAATSLDYDGDATDEVVSDGSTVDFDPDDDGTAELSISSGGALIGLAGSASAPTYSLPGGVLGNGVFSRSENHFNLATTSIQRLEITNDGVYRIKTGEFGFDTSGGVANEIYFVPSGTSLSFNSGGTIWTTDTNRFEVAKQQVNTPSAQTCVDSGDGSPGTLSLTVSGTSYVALTNADAHGCTVTLSETGATNGQRLEVVVVSSAGGTVDFADTSGVSETAGAFNATVWQSITYRYAVDRWAEISRSAN